MSDTKAEEPLHARLQRLELDRATKKQETQHAVALAGNPFMRRRRSKSLSSINFGPRCDCARKNLALRQTTSFKRSDGRVLREPLLKSVRCPHGRHKKQRMFGQCYNQHKCDYRSIIDACKQLALRNRSSEEEDCCYTSESFQRARSRSSGEIVRNDTAAATQSGQSNGVNTSCSQQARMNGTPPCDVTIDELASYFETFVHIPKKMSSMAEMMYI